MYELPGYIWAITLVGVIGIPALTCVVLFRGARRAGLGARTAALLTATAAVLLGGWTAATAAIAGYGRYQTQLGQQPPWLPIAVVATLVALLAATQIPVVARAIAAPGMSSQLTLVHTLRLVGAAFLLTMALGHLPALFALPAGLGDIAVGLTAPLVAHRLDLGTGRRGALWFNALGIIDLVVALSLGGLTGYQLIDITPSADAIAELPLALIPTAAVPLLLALHITSLRQLATPSRADRGTSDDPEEVAARIARPSM